VSALTEALVAAQKELPTAIERDAQGLGYRYTSLDKLIEATRPILSKYGLAISQWPDVLVTHEKIVPVLVTRIDYSAPEPAIGRDYGYIEYRAPLYVSEPKGSQELGAAVTYMRRYAWAAALGIASEEDTDAATLKPEDDVPF